MKSPISRDSNLIRFASMKLKNNSSHSRCRRAKYEQPIAEQEPNFRWLFIQATKKPRYHDIMSDSESEVDRLHMQNDLMKMAFDSNYSAPIDHILPNGHVLDIGCGPGYWMLDMSSHFPNTTFYGLDFNSKFPLPEDTPKNCVFGICNVIEGIPFPDNYFDYVHSRFMCLAFTKEQFETVVKEMIRVTKVGGYVELIECEMMMYRAGPLATKINEKVLSYFVSKESDPTIALQLDALLSTTHSVTSNSFSFTPAIPPLSPTLTMIPHLTPPQMTIVQKYHSFPIGIWGGRLGVLFREDLEDLLSSFRPWLAPLLVNEPKDECTFEDVIRAAIRETDERQSFMNFHICWGKKVAASGAWTRCKGDEVTSR